METQALLQTFKKIIGEEIHIRSLRDIVTYLLQAIKNPDASSQDIAKVIMSDPALAARILTIANSPVMGIKHKVADLSLAISLLGHHQVRDIIMNIAIIEKIERRQGVQLMQLWKHSFYCGKIAEVIALDFGKYPGEAFTLGLLHDIGKILLCYSNERAFFSTIHNYKHQQGKLMHWQSEKQLLGISHAEIGGLAAYNLNLPEFIYKVIWAHHSPHMEGNNETETFLAELIYISDIIAWTLGFPSIEALNPFLNSDPYAIIDQELLKKLGLTKSRFQQLLGKINEGLRKNETIFDWLHSK